MPRTPESGERARSLAAALGVRELVIEQIDVDDGSVPVPSYPDGPRPTAVVQLSGRGHTGTGESVAWTDAAQEQFKTTALGMPIGHWRLGKWAATIAESAADPYTRAALEAAAIDLALKQAAQADRELQHGRDRGPLHGIPWGVKDVISYPGYPTTSA